MNKKLSWLPWCALATLAPLYLAIFTEWAVAATPPDGTRPWAVDFTRIPVTQSWDEAKATLESRRQAITWSIAVADLPAAFTGGEFPDLILSRLLVGYQVEEANAAVMRESTRPWGTGTNFDFLGPICKRKGDYDFALKQWMIILYRFWDQPTVLFPVTRDKILHELATEAGNYIHYKRKFCGIPIPETENHILMTETSKLLTNQLLNRERRERGLPELAAYDNDRNGMNQWMLKHLQWFMRYDFSEYNSRPYQPYAIMAILNLYDFAQDERVRTMSRNVLDYLSAKFAASSTGLRRIPAFARNLKYREIWDLFENDGESSRMLGMTGAASFLRGAKVPMQWDWSVGNAFNAVWSNYTVPDEVGDLLYRRQGNSHFLRMYHHGLEVYSREPEFLISGGGIYTKTQKWMPWQMTNDGWARPTVLIPTEGAELDAHQLVRIEGHRLRANRVNTGVAPGFASGLNPEIPELSAECQATGVRKEGAAWTFIDYTQSACTPFTPGGYGYYVAVYRAQCDTKACSRSAKHFGFFEAKSSVGLGFADFVAGTLARNGSTPFSTWKPNHYVTASGRDIEFEIFTGNKWVWPILSIDGVAQERRTWKWPLASGIAGQNEAIVADTQGLVVVHNAALGRRLVLDSTDPLQPSRRVEATR